jgi:hypothetical protein
MTLFGQKGNQPTTTTKDFSRSPTANIQRSSFNRDHGLKTTINADYLYPVFYDEALPGDSFNLNATGFGRLATPINPFMDNLYVQTYFFSVPYRILWQNWEKFMGEQINPGDSIDYSTPQIQSATVVEETLFDYFGLPTGVAGINFNNFAGRAYNMVWNEWFRDENLQNSTTVDLDDGPDTLSDYTLLKKGKQHDYFTSALPWPQKGDAVTLPLGGAAEVKTSGANNDYIFVGNDDATYANTYLKEDGAYITGEFSNSNTPNLYADLSGAAAATVNQLREAFQVQAQTT